MPPIVPEKVLGTGVGHTTECVISVAYKALYRAKAQGRNHVVVVGE